MIYNIFISFLIDENIKDRFTNRLKLTGSSKCTTIKSLIHHTKDPNDLIYKAFTWRKYNEVLFWTDISIKWKIFYRDYKLKQLGI